MNVTDYNGHTITEPGAYFVPEQEYHADPVKGGSLSHSGMKHLLKSPAHFRHYMDAPREERKAFDEGHIVHALVLGQPLNVTEIPASALASNGAASTNEAREFIAMARLDGLIPVKPGELDKPRAVAEAVLAHRPARALFETDLPAELSLFAPDPHTGVWLRGRIDKVAEDVMGETVLVDLKTTPDADPNEFRRSIARYAYYLQSTVYRTLWQWASGDRLMPEMQFVAVSKTEPHLVTIHRVDWAFEDLGEKHMRLAIDRYKAGTDSGEWPGYPPIVYEHTPPVWLLDDENEEMEV